ncbi:MAG: hypothetical protein AAFV43_05145 [Planctomycetota bacterium]
MTQTSKPTIDRRSFHAAGLTTFAASLIGCSNEPPTDEGGIGRLEAVWGRHGVVGARIHKPRAIAIDGRDHLYIVDFTARILVYDAEGEFLRSWQTPESENGRPTGLTFDRSRDQLMVADTHYYRVLFYTPEGELMEDATIGGVNGKGRGEFGFVTDAVRDADGCVYVAEYGDNDRIQKFSPEGEHLKTWGAHGTEPEQFRRPQNMTLDAAGRLWVCDACNHRLQVFDTEGELLSIWGEEGSAPGGLYYPYDIVFDEAGDLVLCEYGNHRLQKFSPDGESLGVWGGQGRDPGRLWDPWALVRDSTGRLHVLDTGNHRIQRVAT